MSLVPLPTVQADLPFSIASIYSGFARGRYPWLQKHGPDEHRGRMLWVDVNKYNEWAANRGQVKRLTVKNGEQR